MLSAMTGHRSRADRIPAPAAAATLSPDGAIRRVSQGSRVGSGAPGQDSSVSSWCIFSTLIGGCPSHVHPAGDLRNVTAGGQQGVDLGWGERLGFLAGHAVGV